MKAIIYYIQLVKHAWNIIPTELIYHGNLYFEADHIAGKLITGDFTTKVLGKVGQILGLMITDGVAVQ